MTYEKVKNLNPEEFKRFCGVYPETFKDMVKVLAAEKVLPKKSGRPSKLSLEDQILMTLEYLREYITDFHLAINWEINETTALRITRKVMIKSGLFNLLGKKTMHQVNSDLEVVAVDVAEHEIERPQKKQKDYDSGKQGYHTIKSQVLAAQKTGMIICTAHGKRRIHDFNLWKNSQIGIDKSIECLADNGDQGIQKPHKNSRSSNKKKKNQELSLEEKEFNRQLSRERIVIESIHRSLKIFRILSSRYRNRRRRFGLRFSLIAGIDNYELALGYHQVAE